MKCPNCGNEYSRIGQHWAMSCGYPNISEDKRYIFSGLLMGDGYIPNCSDGNSQMRIRMVNEDFLCWLDSEISWLSCGVRFIKSAKDSAKDMRNRGYRPNAKEKNYSDVYELNTRTHPYFTSLRNSWYTPNKKFNKTVIPHNYLTYKMWYVTDGGLCKRESRNPYAYFRMDSNSHFAKTISTRLSNIGIESNVRDGGNVLAITTESTPDFLDYIGEPIKGFEYKW